MSEITEALQQLSSTVLFVIITMLGYVLVWMCVRGTSGINIKFKTENDAYSFILGGFLVIFGVAIVVIPIIILGICFIVLTLWLFSGDIEQKRGSD
jgi:hypothetical protein